MISLGFPEHLFSEEALKNTQRRIDEMLEEFEDWRDWDELEKGRGVFPSPSKDLVIV